MAMSLGGSKEAEVLGECLVNGMLGYFVCLFFGFLGEEKEASKG